MEEESMDTTPLLNPNQEVINCIIAAKYFSKNCNLGSYARGREYIEQLVNKMDALHKVGADCVKFLTSCYIVPLLSVAVSGKCPSANQNCDANLQSTQSGLSHVVTMTVLWAKIPDFNPSSDSNSQQLSRYGYSTVREILQHVCCYWNKHFNPKIELLNLEKLSTTSEGNGGSENTIHKEEQSVISVQQSSDTVKECILAAQGLADKKSTEGVVNLYNKMIKLDAILVKPAPVMFLLGYYIAVKLYFAMLQGANVRQSTDQVFSKIISMALNWWNSCEELTELLKDSKSNLSVYAYPDINDVIREAVTNWNTSNNDIQINILSWPNTQPGYVKIFTGFRGPELGEHSISKISAFDIKLDQDRLLKHATSVKSAINILKSLSTGSVQFNSMSSQPPKFVWFGVNLSDDEEKRIPQWAQTYALENRYGSVVFKFPIEAIGSDWRAFKIGSRKFIKEYSQVIFFSKSLESCFFETEDGKMIELEEINVSEYNWKLEYSSNGDWTHPEIVFLENVTIPEEYVKLSFVSHAASCPSGKKDNCTDCISKIETKAQAIEEFKKLLRENENAEEILRFLKTLQ